MTTDDLLRQGIAALQAGRKSEAHRLLMQVIERDKRSEMAWLWLSGTVDTDEDRRTCLENVLAINPNNDSARLGIKALRSRVAPPASGSRVAPEAESSKDEPAQWLPKTRRGLESEPQGKAHKPELHAKGKRPGSKTTELNSVSGMPGQPRRLSAANWMMFAVVLLLVGCQIWMHSRVSRLEKVLAETQSQIAILASELARVAALAENANRYAHWHW